MMNEPRLDFVGRASMLRVLPRRNEHAHKWGVGGLLIVGGAPGYIGAPALAAMSAGRSGAGIVNLAIPRSSVGPTATLVPEAVFIPLPETDSSHGVQKAIEAIGPIAAKCRAIVVGPGLSRDEAAGALLEALFGGGRRSQVRSVGFSSSSREVETTGSDAIVGRSTPAVVDADALHWLAGRDDWWTQMTPFSLVLTPHAGELSALTGADAEDIAERPASAVLAAAEKWQQFVVLKAGKAWISDGDAVRTVEQAAPALATAGSGDVLAGSIGALLAQGLAPLDAASLAVFAGTQAATLLAAELSSLGVLAGDLPRTIARVLADLEQEGAAHS